jgi:hypothetical protein
VTAGILQMHHDEIFFDWANEFSKLYINKVVVKIWDV